MRDRDLGGPGGPTGPRARAATGPRARAATAPSTPVAPCFHRSRRPGASPPSGPGIALPVVGGRVGRSNEWCGRPVRTMVR